LRWWEKFGTVFDKILLSCHHKEVDIDHFIKVSDTLHEMGRSPNVMVLMDPNAWDKCLELIETCKTSKHPWFISAMEVMNKEHLSPSLQKDDLAYGTYGKTENI
jgi:hypothetical protein